MRTRRVRCTTCFGLFALGALTALTPVCVWSKAGENGKADTVLLADGTPIHLVLMDDLQGEKLQVKQTVHFKVRQDLVVASKLIVQTGTEAIGHVDSISPLVRSRRKHACGNDDQCLCQPRSKDTGPLEAVPSIVYSRDRFVTIGPSPDLTDHTARSMISMPPAISTAQRLPIG